MELYLRVFDRIMFYIDLLRDYLMPFQPDIQYDSDMEYESDSVDTGYEIEIDSEIEIDCDSDYY